MGSISVDSVHEPRAELFYWTTITLSQTLGTALGDWTADSGGFGYGGAAIIFGALLAILAVLYFRTTISRVTLFWAAFILTRPLGATVGDFLDKPLDHGGLAFSRPLASAVLAAAILLLILLLPQRFGIASATSRLTTATRPGRRSGKPQWLRLCRLRRAGCESIAEEVLRIPHRQAIGVGNGAHDPVIRLGKAGAGVPVDLLVPCRRPGDDNCPTGTCPIPCRPPLAKPVARNTAGTPCLTNI